MGSPATPLVARDEELAALRRFLADEGGGLLSIVGGPGVGKSHLAAHALSGGGDEEVLFIDDADVDVEAVRARVVAAMADDVRVLVTARSPLRVRGERLLELRPLAVVTPGAAVEEAPAVRALAALCESAGIARGDVSAPVLATIAAQLDGVPLALELAAYALAPRPDARFAAGLDDDALAALLDAGLHGGPAHHRSLRACVERAFVDLPAHDVALLSALSVLRGTFNDVDGAEIAGVPVDDVKRAIAAAAQGRILLSAENARWWMPWPVRAVLESKLADRTALFGRHVRMMAARAPRIVADPALADLERQNLAVIASRILRGEIDLGRDATRGDTAGRPAGVVFAIHADAIDALVAWESMRARTSQLALVSDALAKLAVSSGEGQRAVRLFIARSTLARQLGRTTEAQELLDRAKEILDALPEAGVDGRDMRDVRGGAPSENVRAWILDRQTTIYLEQGRLADATDLVAQLRAAALKSGDVRAATRVSIALAMAVVETFDTDRARSIASTAAAECHASGDELGRLLARAVLGCAALIDDDLAGAASIFASCAAGFAVFGDDWRRGQFLAIQAIALASLDDVAGAERAIAVALVLVHDATARGVVTAAQGTLALARGRAALARGDAQAFREELGYARARAAEIPQTLWQVRMVRRLLLRAIERIESGSRAQRVNAQPLRTAANDAVAVDVGFRRFRVPGGDVVDLGRKQLLVRLLRQLVTARLESAGRAIAREELIAAGWPGERITERAARNRLHVALHELRRLGLDAVLQSAGEGHLLDPAVAVVFVEDDEA